VESGEVNSPIVQTGVRCLDGWHDTNTRIAMALGSISLDHRNGA